MQASFTGTDQGLRSAAAYVNRLDSKEKFWSDIAAKPKFDYATISSQEIQRRLRAARSTITIKLWTPKPEHADDYKNTIAVTDSRYPRTIFYHTKFLNSQKTPDKVNTIVHEFVHNVDVFDDGDKGEQMGHGNNSSVGKKDSAPYWIGDLAERHYNSDHNLTERKDKFPYEHQEITVDESEIVQEPEAPLRDEEADILDDAER